MLYLLTFGPLALTLYAWTRFLSARERQRVRTSALVALGLATANALMSSGIVLYYAIHPTPPTVPPWEDPLVLDFALLLLLALVGALLGLLALIRGSAKWLVAVVEVASAALVFLGIMAAGSF